MMSATLAALSTIVELAQMTPVEKSTRRPSRSVATWAKEMSEPPALTQSTSSVEKLPMTMSGSIVLSLTKGGEVIVFTSTTRRGFWRPAFGSPALPS